MRRCGSRLIVRLRSSTAGRLATHENEQPSPGALSASEAPARPARTNRKGPGGD